MTRMNRDSGIHDNVTVIKEVGGGGGGGNPAG
jgi:hypothetical protein